MYDAYIFDFYGTLCETHTDEEKPDLWQKMSEVYCAYGASYSGENLKNAYHRTLKCQIQENLTLYEKGLITKDERDNFEPDVTKAFSDMFLEKGVTPGPELSKHIAVTFRALSRDRITICPGVKELLTDIRNAGKHVYLLSNAQTDFTRPEIEMLGLTECFDDIFISSEQKVKKPGEAFFRKLVEKYGLDVKRSVMTGNDETADIQGALKCGMDCLLIQTATSPKYTGRYKPTYFIPDGDFTKVRGMIFDAQILL